MLVGLFATIAGIASGTISVIAVAFLWITILLTYIIITKAIFVSYYILLLSNFNRVYAQPNYQRAKVATFLA